MYFIEYEDRQSGKTYTKYFHNRPVVTNAYCPSCRNQVMEQTVIPHPSTVTKIEYHCLHCGDTYEIHDSSFLEVNKNPFEPILYLDVYETLDRTVIFEDDLGSVAKGLSNSKDEKVRILVPNDNLSDTVYKHQDIDNAIISEEKVISLQTPVVTPQHRSIRYTPEFIEKATKAMRDTPLKRQNIHVHEDDMESTCPACGYMLYEEANMIFNYCPTCGQALNNSDFSEENNK